MNVGVPIGTFPSEGVGIANLAAAACWAAIPRSLLCSCNAANSAAVVGIKPVVEIGGVTVVESVVARATAGVIVLTAAGATTEVRICVAAPVSCCASVCSTGAATGGGCTTAPAVPVCAGGEVRAPAIAPPAATPAGPPKTPPRMGSPTCTIVERMPTFSLSF